MERGVAATGTCAVGNGKDYGGKDGLPTGGGRVYEKKRGVYGQETATPGWTERFLHLGCGRCVAPFNCDGNLALCNIGNREKVGPFPRKEA